jgi:hypothetical protein
MWLQDYSGVQGTEGSVTYNGNLQFKFSCPTGLSWNSASGPGNNFIARSAGNDWQARGKVPWLGHPLQVRFTVQ